MKRILTMFIVAMAVCSTATAQSSMTDDEIIALAKRERLEGMNNQQIVSHLMARGVSVARLQTLRRRLEQEQNDEPLAVETEAKEANTQKAQRAAANTGKAGTTELGLMIDDMSAVELNTDPTDGKPIFGHSIFRSKALSFEPSLNLPAPDYYRLGAGDAVVIDIYGASQKTIEATIAPDGCITIEGIGPVSLVGLTVAQANQRVRNEVGQRYSSSQVQLTVRQTKAISVNVMGEVQTPGTYTLSAFATVFHALYRAGGPGHIGTLRAIKLYRNGALRSTIDVYEYILGGKMTGNVVLEDGDVIVVDPYDCLVEVVGKVKRPMLYEMKSTETVADLLRYAGGFTGDAYTSQVQLMRKTGVEKSVHMVDEFAMGSFAMHDQDEVNVFEILQRYSNMVEIKGAVFRPGQYELGTKVNTVKALIETAGGLTEVAFTDHVVMHRRRPDRTLTAQSVNLTGIMNGTIADMPLYKDDIIYIPTRTEMVIDRTVTISGEVHEPGTYSYAEGETLEDLILQAGNLTDMASVARVDVARRTIDPHSVNGDSVTSQTFSFSVKEGFVIDGTPGFVLQPYDHVSVRRSPGSKMQRMVTINGEVQFGGSYAIDRPNMRLSDLVKMAGGPTYMAYVRGARLERVINAQERVRMRAVLEKARMDAEERANANKETNNDNLSFAQALARFEMAEKYYVGIHLDEALANPGSDADIVLREGDVLVLPEYSGTVRINGEVMQTNTVAYEKGKKAKYYINQAGGYSLNAKKSRAYIFYANGTMARAKKAKIEPGCEIVVPAKMPARHSLAEYMSVATTSASLATMMATIANLIK